MTQWQAIATYYLTDNMLSHAIPGLGLFVTMLGIAIFKMLTVRPTKRAASGWDSA